ncbi:uncharacterized [Tachysurus ichikawai]
MLRSYTSSGGYVLVSSGGTLCTLTPSAHKTPNASFQQAKKKEIKMLNRRRGREHVVTPAQVSTRDTGSHEGIYTSYYCGPTTPWFYGEEARGLGTSSGYEQMHLLHLFVNTDRAVPPGVGKEKGKEHLGSRKKGLRRKAGI